MVNAIVLHGRFYIKAVSELCKHCAGAVSQLRHVNTNPVIICSNQGYIKLLQGADYT